MVKISYFTNIGDPDGKEPSVIIYGEKFGEKIEMTEMDFKMLYLEYEEKQKQAYDDLMPIEQRQLRETQRSNQLLQQLLGKIK